jgi:phosphotransferase system enzyme I (PtsI)
MDRDDDGPDSGPTNSLVIDGIPGSPGFAIGRAVVIDTRRPGVPRRHVPRHQADDEVERFATAVRLASESIRDVTQRARNATRAEASILEAYVMMVEDETLRTEVERHIRIDRQCAEWALDSVVRHMVDQLRSARDPYLAERSHDVEFVGDRLLRALVGRQMLVPVVPVMEEAGIIVAHDLSPAETAGLSKDRVKAIVTEVGTRTSHTAILARALEIPAVVGARKVTSLVANGELLVVDGMRGQVVVSPTPVIVDIARARAERYQAVAHELRDARDRPAATRCGQHVALEANIELPTEAVLAIEHGAQGVGLYRTEFLYISRIEPPPEEEQFEIYKAVLSHMAPRPVVLRTFDIGGDKFMTAFQAPAEMNPALGLRAIRLGLAHPELLNTQLRAMVRASAFGQLSIMVPMVSSLREMRAVREMLALAVRSVREAGHAHASQIPLGMMVEVPAAAIMADEFAKESDFFSIGTNDLVQYALAVDRTNQELAHLASPYHPAILRLIKQVVEAGARHGKPVGVCGAMASEPLGAALLIGLGIRELSMEASSIPAVKAAIGRLDCADARGVADDVLSLSTAKEVEQRVLAAFGPSLRDLLGPEDF